MVDVQINSIGIEFIIDIVLKVDDFDSVSAQIGSPSGTISFLTATKDQEKSVRVKLLDHLDEIGIWTIQVIGEKSALKSYTQVGYFRVDENIQDIF